MALNVSTRFNLEELAASVAVNNIQDDVMDFLIGVDAFVADYDFTRELVVRLATDLAGEVGTHASEVVTIPDGFGDKRVTFSQLYEGLSYLDEDTLIALLANAVTIKRERDAEAVRNV